MSNRKKPDDLLLDLMANEILSDSENDMKKLYGVDDLAKTKTYQSTKSLVDSLLLQHKKSRLLVAKEKVKFLKKGNDDVIKNRLQRGKEKLIALMAMGSLPKEITMAFRDGKELPDDEIESILEDLKELGLDLNDDE